MSLFSTHRRRSGLAFVPNLLTRQFPYVIEKKET